MTIVDVFETSKHRKNIAHFTAIVNLAAIDGEINQKEAATLKGFAKKLDISSSEYKSILKHPDKQPFIAINSCEERLKHIYDLFTIIYADHDIDIPEKKLIIKYIIGLGVPIKEAHPVLEKSIKIFRGHLDFDAYQDLMNK